MDEMMLHVTMSFTILTQVEKGDKLFGKKNAMQPMGRPKHALKALCFLFFFPLKGGGGEGFFFHFSLVPNVFPLCSL